MTNLFLQIQMAIKQQMLSGKNQQEIASLLGVTQSHISRIISGKFNIEGMKIGTLYKLSPKVVIDLNCDLNDSNNNVSPLAGGVDIDKRINDIIDKVMQSDLNSESKIKVYNIIKKQDPLL